jgi:hypothetical protein
MIRWAELLGIGCMVIVICEPLDAMELELSGYYENTFQAEHTRGEQELLVDASKLRLEFSAGGSAGELEFLGNLNAIAFHAPVSIDIRRYLPASAAEELSPRDSIASRETFSLTTLDDRVFLDNAFLSWQKGPYRVRAGKQQFSWGPGYSYNPTDLFHRKDLLDPAYEKEGVVGLRLDRFWGIGNEITAIWAANDQFETSGYALRVATHLPVGYDLALTLHQVEDTTRVDLESRSQLAQRRRAAGLEMSGSLLGLGFWIEGNYNQMEIDDEFLRVIAGIDYTFTNGLYVMTEGLFNERGETGPPYPVEDWLAWMAFGEPVGRSMILVGTRDHLSALVSGSFYCFAGLDGGFMINPRLDLSVARNADLTIFGATTVGDRESQFPSGLVSIVARASVYF